MSTCERHRAHGIRLRHAVASHDRKRAQRALVIALNGNETAAIRNRFSVKRGIMRRDAQMGETRDQTRREIVLMRT